MPGLMPGIHVLLSKSKKTWMAGTSPAMTRKRNSVDQSGMQNDAGADFGERNAEHQGDEVFVHGESPFAISTINPF
jgi:hypothetical protein